MVAWTETLVSDQTLTEISVWDPCHAFLVVAILQAFAVSFADFFADFAEGFELVADRVPGPGDSE